MVLLILLLPLYNFIFIMIFSMTMGSNGVIVLALFNLLIGLICVLQLFQQIISTNGFFFYDSPLVWIDAGAFLVKWDFFIDSITIVMLFVIYIISFLVHIYSISYMKYDPHFIRFFALLSLFTFFMIVLVMSSNLVQLFLGWEGVGLCSYLLINFWFTRVQANKAALKAMFVNKIGDSFLLLALVLIYYIFKSVDYFIIFSLIDVYKFAFIKIFNINIHIYTLISFCLFFAAMGKSAQLGLHTWLPDAMEGPTPVSALIHAATMVTAGVFLLIRLNCFFEYSYEIVSKFIVIIGCLTAFFGAIVAIVQNDIKKIIAYSTCSQLGYMFVACGFFRYDIALFHLFNHAFFKALLFLSAGMLIYMYSDEQDIRRMGGLNKLLSYIYIMILIGSYSLMGLPFFSGFYSKEVILEICFAMYNNFGFLSYLFLILAAFCTSIYSTRLIHLVFFDTPKGFYVYYKNIKEYDNIMSIVLFILALFSIFSGFFFKDLLIGFGSDFLLFIHKFRVFTNVNNVYFDYEFINIFYKHIPLFVNIFGIISYFFYFFVLKELKINRILLLILDILYKFLINKWYFDYLYNYFFVKYTLYLSYDVLYKDLDKNYLELFGPYGIYKGLKKLSDFFSKLNKLSLFQFFFIFNLSLMFIFLFVFFIISLEYVMFLNDILMFLLVICIGIIVLYL